MTAESQFRDLVKVFASAQSTVEYHMNELESAKKSAAEAHVALIEALRNDDTVRAIRVDDARVILVKRNDNDIDLEMIACR